MWSWSARGLVVCAAVILAASFAGEVHGLGDSLAVFRPIILIGCLVVSGLVWRWRGAQVLAVIACLGALWHGAGFLPHGNPRDGVDLTLYQKNMMFRPSDRTFLMADLRLANADVVTLQEVSRVNLAMLDNISDLYPYQLVCDAHSVGAVAVLSRTPLLYETCARALGFASAVTVVRGTLVQVVSVHLHWPWPHLQQDHTIALIKEIPKLDGGVTVIGGDFNMVPSGRTLTWFEQATATARVGRLVRTFDLFGYPLGIDHVLATGGTGTLSVRPQLGSDHFGLVASVAFP
jgi:endonuclease/exonuclease/phosphatase (EEP) superfamily protein YafD